MKILVNYANCVYKKTQKINSITGKLIGGFDRVCCSYGPEDIDENYYKEHKNILS